MRVAASGVVFDATGRAPAERVAFFDGLCRLSSGTWLCGFALGNKKHAVAGTLKLCRSRDDGNVWEEIPFRFANTVDGIPGSLAGAEFVEVEPQRLLLCTTWFDRSDPERPLFDPETEGLLHARLLVAESADEGTTWSAWREIETPGLTGCALTGPPLQWADGTIAVAFESFKHYDDPTPARHAAWLAVSRDGGRTFPDQRLVARDLRHAVYYWDQRLCATDAPGEYVGLFWTHDREAKRDLTVHFVRSSLAESESRSPAATTIPGQIAAPVALADEGLLAFVVDRNRPGTMTLWQSRDGGTSWPRETAMAVHVHDERAVLSQGRDRIDFRQYWEDMGKWSFGHPAARLFADGRRLLLTYYAGSPDTMSIHWARVDLE